MQENQVNPVVLSVIPGYCESYLPSQILGVYEAAVPLIPTVRHI